MNDYKEKLGTPDLKLHRLQIWIHGRQFPEANDYWDGNWVNVTAHCGAEGSDVWISGPKVHLSTVEKWLKQIELMHEKSNGKADLDCIEPNLFVEIEMGKEGRASVCVQITPNVVLQKREFKFEVDETHISKLTEQLKEVLRKFPTKDK